MNIKKQGGSLGYRPASYACIGVSGRDRQALVQDRLRLAGGRFE
jgi:hypothetical protein